jgi:four helix bundle protein
LNYAESNAAESRKDLIHKRRICLKEAKESEVAIEILVKKNYLDRSVWQPVMKECGEIVAILIASTKSLSGG